MPFEKFGKPSGEFSAIEEGIYEAQVVDFVEVTNPKVLAYADFALEVKYDIKDIPFQISNTVYVKFDRLPSGDLNPAADKNSWRYQLYNLFESLGYDGGYDAQGRFRNENAEFADMAEELAKHITNNPTNGYPYVVHVMRDKKGYMVVNKRVFKSEDRGKLEAWVNKKPKQPTTTPQAVSGAPKL